MHKAHTERAQEETLRVCMAMRILRMRIAAVFVGMSVQMLSSLTVAVHMEMHAFPAHPPQHIECEQNQHDTDGKFKHRGNLIRQLETPQQRPDTNRQEGERMTEPQTAPRSARPFCEFLRPAAIAPTAAR